MDKHGNGNSGGRAMTTTEAILNGGARNFVVRITSQLGGSYD